MISSIKEKFASNSDATEKSPDTEEIDACNARKDYTAEAKKSRTPAKKAQKKSTPAAKKKSKVWEEIKYASIWK